MVLRSTHLPSRVDTNLDRRYIRLYEFWLQTDGMLRVFLRGLGLVAELIQIQPMPPRPRFSPPLTRFFRFGRNPHNSTTNCRFESK